MSRHKNIRNLDLANELDDYDADGYEDDYSSEMTEDEERQMRSGVQTVRATLGNDIPGLTDHDIRESLWYYYFDVPKTVSYILTESATSGSYAPPKPSSTTSKPKETKKDMEKSPGSGIGRGLGITHTFDEARKLSALELGYFLDSPWGNVPAERQGELVFQGYEPKGGLLGGSSTKTAPKDGKISKLAALAKAKKQKHPAASGERRQQTSLLSRLSQKSQDEEIRDLQEPSELRQNAAGKALAADGRVDKLLPQLKSPAPEEEQTRLQNTVKREPVEDQLSPLRATPSTFAHSMFGAKLDAYTKMFVADGRMFDVIGGNTKEKKNAFAEPSPDDIVLAAQSGRHDNIKPSTPRQTKPVIETAESLANLELDNTSQPKRERIDVLDVYSKSQHKNNINLVVIGHVDAGKSTLMGRLLYDSGVVDERTVEKYKRDAESIGKSSFALAWVLDQTQEERSRGVTMDIASNKFETEKTSFTILDAPGHRDFIPNMLAGAAQADVALLVIDAGTGAFESGFHLRGQTKEHTLLVRSMGVQQIVVAVNKLDTVSWSQERFTEIEQQMSQFLLNAGFSSKKMRFVPCSGLGGENVVIKAKEGRAPWYTGPTLVQILELSLPVNHAIDKPLRMTITDVFRGGIQHPVSVSGRIDAGNLQGGDLIYCAPSGEKATIKSLSIDEHPAEWAVAGHNVILHLSGIDMVNLKPGDVLCDIEAPLLPIRSFSVKLLAFESLTPAMVDIHRGRLHTSGRISKLIATIDKTSGEVSKKKPRHIAAGSVAMVEVRIDGDGIPLEVGDKVVLRSNGVSLAAGIVS